jgi:hypothetical protein
MTLLGAAAAVGAGGLAFLAADEAAAPLPETSLQSGTFRPTYDPADSVIAFNAPAPSADGNAALSVFDGSNPNGTWRLFVQDDFGPGDSGSIAGDWALGITAEVDEKVRHKKQKKHMKGNGRH